MGVELQSLMIKVKKNSNTWVLESEFNCPINGPTWFWDFNPHFIWSGNWYFTGTAISSLCMYTRGQKCMRVKDHYHAEKSNLKQDSFGWTGYKIIFRIVCLHFLHRNKAIGNKMSNYRRYVSQSKKKKKWTCITVHNNSLSAVHISWQTLLLQT